MLIVVAAVYKYGWWSRMALVCPELSRRTAPVMRLSAVVLVLCACAWVVAGDVTHLRRKPHHKRGKHHKRGVLSAVPPYKLGHDIPLVTHSIVKPFVVNYPPSASVGAVKVPLSPPHVARYPLPVGHPVPVPHPHYGLTFPHHLKTLAFAKPDQSFHHHHHHVIPTPTVPVLPAPPPVPATPVVPLPNIAHPVSAPAPPTFVQPAAPASLPPPIHIKPLLPAAHFPFQQAAPFVSAPAFPLAQPFPYVLRPGNAVQTSLFATYPRFPLVNYHNPFIPLTMPAPAPVDQLYLERPQAPQLQFVQQGFAPEAAVEHHVHGAGVAVEPTPSLLHPSQAVFPQHAVQSVAPTDQEGWSPVAPQSLDHSEHQFVQQQGAHHFAQEQGGQVLQQHGSAGEEQQYHDYENQLQHHIQQQIQRDQLSSQYGLPQDQQPHISHDYSQQAQEYAQAQEYVQQAQEYAHQNQEYAQHNQEYAHHNQEFAHHNQEYAHHNQEYGQGQEYAHHNQDYAQTNHFIQQQPVEDYGVPHHLGQQYGVPPQGLEGRNAEGERGDGGDGGEGQRYHNHIPLQLQPPIDRPLEHFR